MIFEIEAVSHALLDERLDVTLEGRLGRIVAASDLDLVRAHIEARLLPEQRHRPPHLNERDHFVLEQNQLQTARGGPRVNAAPGERESERANRLDRTARGGRRGDMQTGAAGKGGGGGRRGRRL